MRVLGKEFEVEFCGLIVMQGRSQPADNFAPSWKDTSPATDHERACERVR